MIVLFRLWWTFALEYTTFVICDLVTGSCSDAVRAQKVDKSMVDFRLETLLLLRCVQVSPGFGTWCFLDSIECEEEGVTCYTAYFDLLG